MVQAGRHRLRGGKVKTSYKFIHFEKGGLAWVCKNIKHNDVLGRVAYYEQWCQYVFEASPGCVFSADCLTDIAHFITQLNTQQRKAKK